MLKDDLGGEESELFTSTPGPASVLNWNTISRTCQVLGVFKLKRYLKKMIHFVTVVGKFADRC